MSAQEKAATEKQTATADRVKDLERELAEFKAQDTERGLVLVLGDVQFAPNQDKLTAEAMRKLYLFVTMLKEQPKRPSVWKVTPIVVGKKATMWICLNGGRMRSGTF
jgi:hypothetical protein